MSDQNDDDPAAQMDEIVHELMEGDDKDITIIWDASGIRKIPHHSRWWYIRRWLRWHVMHRLY